jgi:hypothetical protein
VSHLFDLPGAWRFGGDVSLNDGVFNLGENDRSLRDASVEK